MKKIRPEKKIPIEVELTEGYQERFTLAILKICENRINKQQNEVKYDTAEAS